MSVAYKISKIPGLRRALRWSVQRKIQRFQKLELNKQQEDPLNLRNFEKRIYSQNGEDGIIEEIFKRIGTTNQFFVEFGMEDGRECNGRFLLQERQWSGLWIDGDTQNIQDMSSFFAEYTIQGLSAFITKDNIVELFQQGQVPEIFDLLVIDIDGNDYWIWEALKSYQPRVVVIEYNGNHIPPRDWTMPYNKDHRFNGSAHYGASLTSLDRLGRQLGYSLVACDSMGVNAFFVLTSLVSDLFSNTEKGAQYHYCCPKYRGLSFGHPQF